MITFAAICPHPPILWQGKPEKTVKAMKKLGQIFHKADPEKIFISSPHPDWGFEVPLYFLAKNFRGKIEKVLINLESPQFYFEQGKKIYNLKIKNLKFKIALIASGDMSHCLKEDGPYGLHPDGPKFDKALIEALKKKDIKTILKLDDLYPEAGECGFRSFCFVLGILEASGIDWQPEILSYEGPFGVGYLVAILNL